MITHGVAEEQPVRGVSARLVPIAEASRRLRRSVWTLKRLYADGDLPVTIIRNRWFVPESFIDLVFASMRPGRAADFSEVAQAWFVANADPEAVALWTAPAQTTAASARSLCGYSTSVSLRKRRAGGQ